MDKIYRYITNYKLVIVFLLMGFAFVGNSTSKARLEDTEDVVYFYSEKEERFVSFDVKDVEIDSIYDKERKIRNAGVVSTLLNKVTIFDVFYMLKSGSGNKEIYTIPLEIDLYYYTLHNESLTLYFNNGYEKLTNVEKLFFRTSIVRSYTSFDKVKRVEMYHAGIPITNTKGYSLSGQDQTDVLIAEEQMQSKREVTFSFYYITENGKTLQNVQKSLFLEPAYRIERMVIEELLGDNNEAKAIREMIKGKKLVNSIYTQNNICFLDLNKEILNLQLPSNVSAEAFIYSIVNTLTDLRNIDKVQILIDGQVVSHYKGAVLLHQPMKKKYSIIQ